MTVERIAIIQEQLIRDAFIAGRNAAVEACLLFLERATDLDHAKRMVVQLKICGPVEGAEQ